MLVNVMNTIDQAINKAFFNLAHCNPMLYDYWLSELYDDAWNVINEKWNETTLIQMEKDVMYNAQK